MNRRHQVAAAFVSLLPTALSAVGGTIVNPSFEEVYQVGWQTVPTGWDAWGDLPWAVDYDPWWAQVAPTDGVWLVVAEYGLRQTVTLNAGDQILVDVAASTTSSHAYGQAGIQLNGIQGASAFINVPSTQNFSSWTDPTLDWATVAVTVPATGSYELVLFGLWGGNADGFTYSCFDNVRVVPVPGPGPAMLLGITGALGARRRRS